VSVDVLVITDGRRDCIIQTMASAVGVLGDQVDRWWMYDDSGDPDHRAWLTEQFPYVLLAHHNEGRQGFGGAIQAAWSVLRNGSDASHIFHLEDDFTFNRPVDLPGMIEVLDRPGANLAQVALRRQAWNATERRAGGVIEVLPDAYDDHQSGELHWLEHDLFFTTNPSIYRRALLELGWPTGPDSEGRMTSFLRQLGYRFAYFGRRADPPWVQHIGATRVGEGY
jgi:hypothetical protein